MLLITYFTTYRVLLSTFVLSEAVRVVRRNAQQSRQQRRQHLFPKNNNPLPNINHPHHRRRRVRRNNNTDNTSTSTTASGTFDASEYVKELMHALLQRGTKVRMQVAKHPENSRDLTNVFDYET